MSKWIGYLPDFYAASPQIAALQGALEQQTEALWTAENGLIDQLDVNKATWGLSCWEASLGLDVDVSRPDAYRRTRILSKLRGQGATTVAMIQNVAESFYNGQVAVEEQPEAYRFDPVPEQHRGAAQPGRPVGGPGGDQARAPGIRLHHPLPDLGRAGGEDLGRAGGPDLG